MSSFLIAAFTAFMVGVLLRAEAGGDRARRTVAKVLASSGFVALGVLRYEGSSLDGLLLAALVFGAVGDVLLAFEKTFDVGLIAFLVDHLLLIVVFCRVVSLPIWPLPTLFAFAVVGIAVLGWLWPNLGRRKVPVCGYIAAITVMVWGAMGCASVGALPWWVGAAAVLFMLSDILVARQRFITEDFRNRLVGLPMYYAAQLLFALLIGR